MTDAEAGPYRVFAWTEPEPWRAGEVHVSIMVTLAPPPGTADDERAAANRLDEMVNDAAVTVTFAPADAVGDPVVVVTEVQALGSNISYEADTHLPSAGLWRVFIDVEGTEGAGAASFETDVLPARSINMWLLVGGVLLIVAIVGIIGLRRR